MHAVICDLHVELVRICTCLQHFMLYVAFIYYKALKKLFSNQINYIIKYIMYEWNMA